MKKLIQNKQKGPVLSLSNGFSMVEMIVYIAIFSMFVGALVTFALNINNSRAHNQIILEAKGQGADLMRRLTTTIEGATLINTPGTGLSSGVLSINTTSSETTPTIFSGNGEVLFITEGVSEPVALTNNKVWVKDLVFTNVSHAGTKGIIQIRFTITNSSAITDPNQQYSINFYGSSAIR